MLNYYYMYAWMWSIILILYSFQWSSFNQPLNLHIFSFFIITIFISCVLGSFRRTDLVYKPIKDFHYNRKITYAVILGFLADFIYARDIPLIGIISGRTGYMDFAGIPTLHVFIVSMGIFESLLIINSILNAESLQERKRLIIDYVLIVLMFLLQFSRAMLMIIAYKFGTLGVYIILLYCAEALYDIVGQISRGLGKNLVFSVGIISYSCVNLLALLLLDFLSLFSLEAVILSICISYLIGSIVVLLLSKTISYVNLSSVNKQCIVQLCKYSIPIIPSSISLWIVNLSDRVLIIAFLGAGL